MLSNQTLSSGYIFATGSFSRPCLCRRVRRLRVLHSPLSRKGGTMTVICRRVIATVLALPLLIVAAGLPGYAGPIYAGAGQAPPGANDIDVLVADGVITRTASTLDGNPPSTTTRLPSGDRRVRWQGPMNGGSVYGWSIAHRGRLIIESWWFTKDGDKIGLPYPGTLGALDGTGSDLTATLTLGDPQATAQIGNFALFSNQRPDLDADLVAFADFSTSVFAGPPVTGIPQTFTLDPNATSRVFTAAMFPGLFGEPGSLIGFEGTVNGSAFRIAATVPEPSSLALGAIAALALHLGRRRRRQCIAPQFSQSR